MHRSRHHWIFTVAAVFLLLFTAGDLAYPQMCTEDGDDNSGVLSSSHTATTIAADTGMPTPSSMPAHVDDCFCCCGHVIAGVVFHIAVPASAETTRFQLKAHRVAVTPPAAFRPPRVA